MSENVSKWQVFTHFLKVLRRISDCKHSHKVEIVISLHFTHPYEYAYSG